jgi:hypothetical protein
MGVERIGVECRDAAVIGRQVADQEVRGVGDFPLGQRQPFRARVQGAFDLGPGDDGPQVERIVVEHLLEVRHEPLPVDAVAGDPAAHLVAHAACGDPGEGSADGDEAVEDELAAEVAVGAEPAEPSLGPDPRHRVVVGLSRTRRGRPAPILVSDGAASTFLGGSAQAHECGQELQDVHHRRELRCRTEPAPGGIVGIEQRSGGGIELFGAQGLGGRLGGQGAGHRIGHLGQPAVHALGHLVHLVAAIGPRLGHGREHLGERGQIAARGRREVRAGVEGAAGGSGEDRHRPPALTGHRLQRIHVIGVDVGQFLAIDLHGDEPVVEQRGERLVLEGLVGHHVAPMAGGVTDRDQEGHVPAGRLGEGVLRPHPPVDGIVGVRAEVGAGRGGEFIRHGPSVSLRAGRGEGAETF